MASCIQNLRIIRRIIPVILVVMLLIEGCQTENTTEIKLAVTPDEPELFGKGTVSTNMYKRDIAISPNGDELDFTLSDYRHTKRCLVMITKTGEKWGSKKILTFSGEYAYVEPFFSVDGNKLFFASNRPVDNQTHRSDYNIWVSGRTYSGWSEPQPLPGTIL